MSDVIVLRGCLQQKGHIAGCKRGKDCGKKSIVINLSHYHHLKGENGSCHRCSEQSGKRSSHAHHDHGALALLGDMEKLTDTEEYKRDMLIKKIEHAVETMRLSELEAVAYDLFVKGYLSEP